MEINNFQSGPRAYVGNPDHWKNLLPAIVQCDQRYGRVFPGKSYVPSVLHFQRERWQIRFFVESVNGMTPIHVSSNN